MHVGISSAPGAVLPACRIARSTSVSRISGKERVALGTVGASSNGTAPPSAVFWSKFSTKTDLFSAGETAGGWSGKRGSLRGGLRKFPVDLCHLLILKTSLSCVAESSLFCQNCLLALRTALRKSLFVQSLARYNSRVCLQWSFHQGCPRFWPSERFAAPW